MAERDTVARTAERPGFTLIESIAVLILVGLLATYAAVRLDSNNTARLEAEALKAALRYAQSRAMADVYTWGLAFTAGGYTLVGHNPGAAGTALPGQGSASRTMPAGVGLATTGLTNNAILFDWRGQPVTAAITTPGDPSRPATTVQTVTVTQSSGVTVDVTPYTGFIP
jgi:prepilin-type N-terminal cleavage/methylation domain-containing protein